MREDRFLRHMELESFLPMKGAETMNFEPEKIKSAAKSIKLSDDEKSDILSACKENAKPKKKYGRVIAAVAAVFAITVVTVAVVPSVMTKTGMVAYDTADEEIGLYEKNEAFPAEGEPVAAEAVEVDEKAVEESETVSAEICVGTSEKLSQKSTAENSKSKDGGNGMIDEISNEFCIPCRPAYSASKNLDVIGEKITDEEAAKYFETHGDSIISELSSSGVRTDNIRFAKNGYYHISYTGEEGKPLELKQNFRDYIVYNGNSIAAIVTLYKENGKIYDSPAFGAPWFDSFNKKLIAHKGEKLIFVYALNAEIIIAPDGTYFSSTDYDISQYMEGLENPYEFFYTESAVYIP